MKNTTEKKRAGRKTLNIDGNAMTGAECQRRVRNNSRYLLSISEIQAEDVSTSNLVSMLPKLFAERNAYTIRRVLGELGLRCDNLVTVTK